MRPAAAALWGGHAWRAQPAPADHRTPEQAEVSFAHTVLELGAQHTGATRLDFIRDPDGDLVAASSPLGERYYITDGLGSIVAVTGTTLATYTYTPRHGRWTLQDPVVDPLDPKQWNRYIYVGNDPINYIDPTGLSAHATAGCMIRELNPFGGWTEASVSFSGGAAVGATAGVALRYTAGGLVSAPHCSAFVAGIPMLAVGTALMIRGV